MWTKLWGGVGGWVGLLFTRFMTKYLKPCKTENKKETPPSSLSFFVSQCVCLSFFSLSLCQSGICVSFALFPLSSFLQLSLSPPPSFLSSLSPSVSSQSVCLVSACNSPPPTFVSSPGLSTPLSPILSSSSQTPLSHTAVTPDCLFE